MSERKAPLISVIVPVYKAEKYLRRCVDSLLAQTFQDFEVLLVDDGSPDRSGEICDEYARTDSRVRVFHKENGGVSSARNVGLDNIKGDWVAFVDSDDWVDRDYLSIEACYSDADVIEKSFCVINETSDIIRCHKVRRQIISGKEQFYRYYVNKRNNALWNKLIASHLLRNARFDVKVSIGEDFLFFLSMIEKISKYAFSSEGCYFYALHSESAMSKLSNQTDKKICMTWENMDSVKALTNRNELYYLQLGIIYGTYIPLLFYNYKYLNQDGKCKFYHLLKKMRYEDLKFLFWGNKLKLLFLKFFVLLINRSFN